MSVAAPTLTGTHVQLEQLRIEFAEELAAAGIEDRSTYGWTAVPPTVDGMQKYIAGLLDDQQARSAVPFVQRRISDGALVGCTRYLRLEWWAGGDLPAEVEIGGTWLAASAQRTPINTEAKYLLLTNAFDAWNVHRVAICTDSRNEQSRIAIVRIGARFEGILRSHRGSYAPGEENTAARLGDVLGRAQRLASSEEWVGGEAAMSEQQQLPVMLVTGAARGIGAAVARLAAKAGYRVVVNYAASADAAEALAMEIGNDSFAVRADVGDETAVLAMFAEIDRRCGRLDVLINNAGIAGSYGTLDSYTVEALERLWAVNLTGPFLCAREAANRMKAAGRPGSIINLSSKAAVLGGPNEWVHYAASKGGIDTMTIGLSKELAPHNIRVNAVRPGLIESDFHLHATPGRIERMTPMVPMQRAGTANEVAEAVVWLASPAASYVTGAFIEVTGGR